MIPEPIGRSARCEQCGRDLRSCRNCMLYRQSDASCLEPQAEMPVDTERANFCDWFRLNPRYRDTHEGSQPNRSKEEEARKAFLRLFSDESS